MRTASAAALISIPAADELPPANGRCCDHLPRAAAQVRSRMDRVAPRDPEDSSAPEVTGSSAAQPEIIGGSDESTLVQLAQSKYLGQGIKVGVIDDGLDYTHPAFGSCTAIGKGENCRVVAGHDFTDGDDVTYDVCGPHGTHVAGIIGGDMMTAAAKRKGVRNSGGMFVEWRGIAPKAQLGIYRVFACDGTIQTDWLLGALDRAVADGMDIIKYAAPDAALQHCCCMLGMYMLPVLLLALSHPHTCMPSVAACQWAPAGRRPWACSSRRAWQSEWHSMAAAMLCCAHSGWFRVRGHVLSLICCHGCCVPTLQAGRDGRRRRR